jgi:peptidoglycan LD-endopeptidase LytH
MKLVLMIFLLASTVPSDPIVAWNIFEKSVRDQIIPKDNARKQFPALFIALKDVCRKHPFMQQSSWQFPVGGYTVRDMGAGGFKPDIRYGSSSIKGYNFYDGNRHGGHPAYDIFIHDQNRDMLDDRTHKPALILAPVDLLILSVERNWEPDSEIRGGRYVWALDPLQDHIFYFAHLNEIHTSAGAFCKAGSIIGTVGRSGKNAMPARSPTHLHFMVLEIRGSALIPFDYRLCLVKPSTYLSPSG